MKTKEFIRLVEKLGYNAFQFEKDVIVFDSLTCRRRASISKEREMVLDINTDFYVLANLCVEYAKTPIEEREDTKKYIVILPDPNRVGKRVYVLGKSLGSVIVRNAQRHMLEGEDYHLTEKEIKRNHEYLWQFAKEVE